MAESTLRAIAAAGVLSLGLLTGGIGAVPAVAEPSDMDGSSQDSDGPGAASTATTSAEAESVSSSKIGGGGDAQPDSVVVTESESAQNSRIAAVDLGDDSGAVDPGDDSGVVNPGDDSAAAADPGGGYPVAGIDADPFPSKTTRYSDSLTIPAPRLPGAGEISVGTLATTVQSIYSAVESTVEFAVELPARIFERFLAALAIAPTPQPDPGPAFRTQEESPVADATTGSTGGGQMMSEGAVFQAPLVTVPRVTNPGGLEAAPPRGSGVAAVPEPGVTPPGVAGARTPVIHGSLPPTPEVSAHTAVTPPRGQTTRFGSPPRELRAPAVAELAAVALPGVAGLVFLTFSGGVIGYRQADSTRFLRTAGAERFLR
ncbi:hypothetical protein JDV09_02295 [Mycobacterium sp. Y57]|uniref:hypothetical protein n=1 Tax=Mycolicibacterium xanthum TaxID=2796469 RepID=UPI001C84FF87|nr:hypothetical protein [Mycolicibacterium xanthum]MBX7430947.1 hypothetical protein [Mycolicibacterium xanthum]